ncbi:MAG: ISL3 family transposase [Deltaproteobacteria bacterium]|nr:ISL3 family transposase [Deltaproteobacteria bacterium]
MLIESIVRKTLGLKRHCVKRVTEEHGEIVVYLFPDRRCKVVCSSCGRKGPGYDTLKERRWKHVPLWGIPVTLVYSPRRVECSNCGIRVEAIPWTQGKSPLSLPLSVVLATWSKLVAWKVVGELFGFHWNTVRKAVKNVVDYGLANRDLGNLIYIGIDEISRKRGHVYHTQVYDLLEKRLLWSGEDRTSETLEAFFDYLGQDRCEHIEAVCCDMWAPYIDAIKKRLPNALLVFDKFHIVRHLLDAVDKVRKEEAQKLKSEDPELLKKSRYIWLKNPWNLTDNQKVRLSDLEKLNLKINRAYLLKEAFRKFWDYSYKAWAKKYLVKWFWWATHSRLKPMRDFAWMIRRHQDDILNYFKVPLDNGAVEGLNNKAKAISHRAYGYRSAETFKLALYHGMGKLPEPQLTHKFV